jgi:hypothetical protein
VSAKNLKQTNDFQAQLNEPGTQLNGPNSNKREGPFKTEKGDLKKEEWKITSFDKMAKIGLPGGRHDRWCFTSPRGDESGIEQKLFSLQHNPQVYILCVGAEVGEGGYNHWQGFVAFHAVKTAKQVKELLVKESHIEVAKGTTKKNIEYCSKEHKVKYSKNVDNWGGDANEKKEEQKKQRYRTIIHDAETMEPEEFKNKWPQEWYLRRSTVERIMMEAIGKRAKTWHGQLWQKNYWIWGAPGVGKSKWAMEQISMTNILKKNTNKWWCGYNICTTKLVILEDYPALPIGDQLQHHVKVWADRYPFLGEIKNGGTIVETGRIALVITSNYPIERCFSHPEDVEAIKRRSNQIEMTKHNAIRISQAKIDFNLLHQGSGENKKEEEQENEEMNQEEQEDLQNHLNELVEMQEESRRRAQEGLDDEDGEW